MIPFVREFDFAYGRPDRVSPLIRRVVARNPGPFTFTGTGTYIVGRGEVAVIDPGPAEADAPGHLQALLAAVGGERVTHILVTHSHLDHSPLARPLQAATDAPILGRAAEAPHAPLLAGPLVAGPLVAGPLVAGMEAGAEPAFRPDVELADDARTTGPGWTLRTVATPGHASNHLSFALLEENALLCGDHVMGWSTTVVSPPDGDMGAYLDSLDRVIAEDYAVLWPAHGPPITDTPPFLAAYRAHRLEREAQVLDVLSAGPARISDLVPRLYAGVDPWLWPAAAQSVWAHLIHLVRSGRAAVEGDPKMDAVYRLA